METLAIDAVKPGAVLAVAITDARGNVLVGEGRVLTEEWISRLKARNITRVTVQDQAGPSAAGASPGAVSAVRLERFERMFSKSPKDDLMNALEAAARQILEEGGS